MTAHSRSRPLPPGTAESRADEARLSEVEEATLRAIEGGSVPTHTYLQDHPSSYHFDPTAPPADSPGGCPDPTPNNSIAGLYAALRGHHQG